MSGESFILITRLPSWQPQSLSFLLKLLHKCLFVISFLQDPYLLIIFLLLSLRVKALPDLIVRLDQDLFVLVKVAATSVNVFKLFGLGDLEGVLPALV